MTTNLKDNLRYSKQGINHVWGVKTKVGGEHPTSPNDRSNKNTVNILI